MQDIRLFSAAETFDFLKSDKRTRGLSDTNRCLLVIAQALTEIHGDRFGHELCLAIKAAMNDCNLGVNATVDINE